MNKIYILQIYSKTIPSKIIKILTRYKYTHIAIAINKDCNTIYSFGRLKLNNPIKGGFSIENKNGKFYSKFNNTICRIYELEVNEKQYENVKKILYNMQLNKKMYKYDFIGIFFRFFRIPIILKNKYVCSNFVAIILEKAKIYKFNKNVYFIEPKDFEKIEKLKEIYEGYYTKYK